MFLAEEAQGGEGGEVELRDGFGVIGVGGLGLGEVGEEIRDGLQRELFATCQPEWHSTASRPLSTGNSLYTSARYVRRWWRRRWNLLDHTGWDTQPIESPCVYKYQLATHLDRMIKQFSIFPRLTQRHFGRARVVEELDGVVEGPDRRGEPQALGRVGRRRRRRTGWLRERRWGDRCRF